MLIYFWGLLILALVYGPYLPNDATKLKPQMCQPNVGFLGTVGGSTPLLGFNL